MSTTGSSPAATVDVLDEADAAISSHRPLTAADRCDACGAQAYVRVVVLTGELLFCAHHARSHGEKLKEAALFFQDESHTLNAL